MLPTELRCDPDVAKAYERITTVSAGTTQIVFENIRKFANMTCMPHRGWLHNSLDINLTGLESFNVKFLVMCQMPVVITIELCDPRDQVNSILMDNSMLDLHYPLISSADLWRPIILDTDHSELWDDSVEDVSPDYENFMIDLESETPNHTRCDNIWRGGNSPVGRVAETLGEKWDRNKRWIVVGGPSESRWRMAAALQPSGTIGVMEFPGRNGNRIVELD
uniref:Uncharacterized protein n=1 Tax=Timema shepardi TaxID=629360 RepID=A0A7R9G3I1_TIMSH|nr:unnamed protein product [Timema shepardi]